MTMTQQRVASFFFCRGGSTRWQTKPQRGDVENDHGTHGRTASVVPEDTLHTPPLPPWGREGSGAGHEIPVALLSGGVGQRPAVLITTLVFIAGLGPANHFGQHIPKLLCNFTLDRGFLLFTVYWQSVKCFIRQMLPSAQLCSVVTASEDVSVGTHTRVTSGLKACLWMQLFMPFKCCKSKAHREGWWLANFLPQR